MTFIKKVLGNTTEVEMSGKDAAKNEAEECFRTFHGACVFEMILTTKHKWLFNVKDRQRQIILSLKQK